MDECAPQSNVGRSIEIRSKYMGHDALRVRPVLGVMLVSASEIRRREVHRKLRRGTRQTQGWSSQRFCTERFQRTYHLMAQVLCARNCQGTTIARHLNQALA